MGRSRGGKRRTVLQLGDQKESYLSRYGYSRQEDNEEEGNTGTGNQYGGESETDEELDGHQNIPEDDMEEIPLPPMPSTEVVKPKVDIDDKVANFLAEIDALDPEDEPTQSEVDTELKPGFAPIDPKPSFQLNVDQIPSYMEKQETKMPPIKQESKVKQDTKSFSSYKNMFVKGASEFTRPKEDNVTAGKKELKEQWPDEPISDWQQILDDNTQCYYYWNIQTNDVRWEIPTEYTQYLLLRKEYEEKTDRLTKEGKKQPSNPRQIRIAVDGHHLIEPGSSAIDTQTVGPKLPPTDKGSDETPCVSSTSNVSEQTDEASKKNSKPRGDNHSFGPQLPDSTAAKSKKPKLQLVDAIYDDESDECSSTSSEIDTDEETEIEKARLKKQEKKKDNIEDSDLDLDDIDKALEMALEKKKPKEEESKSSSSGKKQAEKSLKKKTLVEEMREQVQKKQEIEARRKAAIEEMMARELERRVGPPRQSSIPEEPAFRPKVMDYEHGRKKSKSTDYDSETSGSSRSRDSNRDSKRKRDDTRKTEKDRDRKRRKDDKDSNRKDRDEKDERKKEKDDKKKDKDRHRDKDERKSDSKKREEKNSKEEEKHGGKKKEEKEKAEKKKIHDESESKENKVKVEPEIVVVPEVKDTDSNRKTDSKEVLLLANMRQQASELAELALSKLEFLEVTKKGLSKLQILLMELETRQYDWQSGGLDTEYFLKKLDEANLQLEHYEKNAAPPGWSCHWDRAYRRYFYMSKRSGRTQWDYPDEEEEEEEMEDNEQESEKDDMETESSEQSQMPVISGEDKNGLPSTAEPQDIPKMPDLEQVTSTTTLSKVKADMTSVSQTCPSSVVPAISTKSAAKSELQAVDTSNEDDEMKEEEEEILTGIPAHDPRDIESALNFIIGADTPIASGEPPPPGTELDMLLIAPPPPPPPIEEYPTPQNKELDPPDETVEDSNINIENPYDNKDDRSSFKSSACVTMETNGLPLPDIHDTENQVHNEGDTVEKSKAIITRLPVVNIARPPQIVSSSANTDGSAYSSSTNIASAVSYEGQSDGVTSQSAPFVTSSTSDPVAGAIHSKPITASSSSSTTEAIATTQDTGHHDKKKKKKDKDKDKSISSASLTLKKKNVSSLVQKWQKVKKEVEIEERHREEREMAIRQKLEEWKKDHS